MLACDCSEEASSVTEDRFYSLEDVGLPAEFGALGQGLGDVCVEQDQLGTVLFLVQLNGHYGVVGWRGEGGREGWSLCGCVCLGRESIPSGQDFSLHVLTILCGLS